MSAKNERAQEDHRRSKMLSELSDPQHRDTLYLTMNSLMGAATGLLFWLVLARVLALPPTEVGYGFAVIGLGTMVGVLGKGGLDTALIRNVPRASWREGRRLLVFAVLSGTAVVILLTLAFALGSQVWFAIPELSVHGWLLVAGLGALLVITWLQDAHFLAEGHARSIFQRNAVFSGARLLLPVPIVALSLAEPVPLAWGLALLVSALLALSFAKGDPLRDGEPVPRSRFLRSAFRNVTGSTAEFLPGLILAPLVLAVDGPEAAAYFGIAWTGASLLFLVSAAISRSALNRMVKSGEHGRPDAIRRASRQLLALILPATIAGIILAPLLLSVLGPDYAREGRLPFTILAMSTLFVAPAYLYLGLLRATERPKPLIVFPAAMMVALLTFAPLIGLYHGAVGVAAAWLIANVPFGVYAAYRLHQETQEVNPHVSPDPDRRHHHAE
ncbi:MAG: lipopolysaccharide biosynthesis protein [Euryarchaeota archaeon]|nr:lipopolysaccharide biosynthesis protein [Euryarchaeota archaeon]